MDLLTILSSSNSVISLKPVCSLKGDSAERTHLCQSPFTISNRPQVSALGFQILQSLHYQLYVWLFSNVCPFQSSQIKLSRFNASVKCKESLRPIVRLSG